MNEVIGPNLMGARGLWGTKRRWACAFAAAPDAHAEPVLTPQPIDPLMIHSYPPSPQHRPDTPIPIAGMLLGQRLERSEPLSIPARQPRLITSHGAGHR
jgi:hypothetical protein